MFVVVLTCLHYIQIMYKYMCFNVYTLNEIQVPNFPEYEKREVSNTFKIEICYKLILHYLLNCKTTKKCKYFRNIIGLLL